MEAFTMKVNLANFFSDERQHALILIDNAWKSIEDVQEHIQILFNLVYGNINKTLNKLAYSQLSPAEGYTFANQFWILLPPKESMRVIKDAGGLKAFTFNEPPSGSVEAGSKKTANKRKKSFDETESSRHSPPGDMPKRSKHRNKSTLQVISLNGTTDEKVNPVLGNSLPVICNNTNEAEEPLSNSTLNHPKRLKQKNKSTLHAISLNATTDNKVNSSLDVTTCDNTNAGEESPLSISTLNKSKRFKSKNKSTNQSTDKGKTLDTNEIQKPMLQISPELDHSSSNGYDNSKAELPVESLSKTDNCLETEHQISRYSLPIAPTLPQPSESQEVCSRAKENNSKLLVPEPPPIAFRCPLMELDSNKVRTYQISFKAKSAQDIERRKSQKKQTDSDDHIKLATPKAATRDPAPLGDLSENTTTAEVEAETESVAPSVDIKMIPRRVCAETINCDSEDDVMVLDDTNMDVDSDVDTSQVVPSRDSQTNDSVMVMFENGSPLKDLPKRGDTLLFKLRQIKGSLSSGLTGVITASCTYINRRTKAVSMEVISSPPGISRVLSQYSNSLDDSCDEIPSLMINLSDLIEAKRPKQC